MMKSHRVPMRCTWRSRTWSGERSSRLVMFALFIYKTMVGVL